MKKALIATAAVAAMAAPQAFAQAGNFTGFSVGLNANLVSASTEISGASTKIGDTTQTASLEGAYGFAMGRSGALGVGLTYNLGDTKAGTIAGTDFKGKDMYSVYVAPGYVLNNDTWLYGKLAYQVMKGELSGGLGSANFDGYGYGAGARAMLSRNLYLQIEFLQAAYGEKTVGTAKLKPSETHGTIGLGYRF